MNGLEITVLLDVSSNAFEIEWPPKSGRLRAFPEVDRASTWKSPD
jgi:predicted NUDIX family NTP pyrophosphohydrolase